MGETDYWTFLDLLNQKRIPLNFDNSDIINEIFKKRDKERNQIT